MNFRKFIRKNKLNKFIFKIVWDMCLPHFFIIIYAICLFYNIITNPHPTIKTLTILCISFIVLNLYYKQYLKRTS